MSDQFSEEAQALARRLFARHCERYGIEGEMADWERCSPAAKAEWQTCATVCLEEKGGSIEALEKRAKAAENALVVEKWERNALEVQVSDLKIKVAHLEVKLANRLGDGIEGVLSVAGVVSRNPGSETDVHGLLVEMSWEEIRNAKRLPLYRRVRVVEVLP